jgi:hypothetical protein
MSTIAPPAPKPGTRKLSDVARHVIAPTGITQTYWNAVRDQCVDLGVRFDRWQDGAGRLILAQRSSGKYAAGIGGVHLSWPRQVGKTYLIGSIIIALCLLRPGLLALWTAHHGKTINETFRAMQAMAKRSKIWPHVLGIRTGNGDEGIEFRNGSRILFGAREHGFGLGFTKVDLIVFDEAQRLKSRTIVDMVPATNAAPNGLVFYIGTPPRPDDAGEVFSARRRKALKIEAARASGDDPRCNILYIELSADPATPKDLAEIDWDQLAVANPSYPHRVDREAIERMWEQFEDKGDFWREAYGIWDELEQVRSAIDPFAWRDLTVRTPPATEGTKAYAVVFHRDGVSVSLSAALKHEHGVHVETIARRPLTEGTYWLVEFFTAERDGRQRHQDAAQIVVFGKAGSTGLANDLRQAGVAAKCLIIGTQDNAITAATMLREAVNRGEVTHLADPDVLDASIAGSREHKVGQSGGWVLVPKTDDDDSTPAESAGMALWAAKTTKRRPGRKTRGAVMA